MVQNTNQQSIPASADSEAIRGADVDGFMRTLSAWARNLPRKEQALLYLVLATAASVRHADVGECSPASPSPTRARKGLPS